MTDEAVHSAGCDRGAGSTGPPRRSLVWNTIYAIGGTGTYYTCQLVGLALLAKFASAEIQGQYFLALAVGTPVAVFFGLELRGAFVADAGNQFTFGTYRGLNHTMMVPAALVLAAFVVWQGVQGSAVNYLMILAGAFAARIIWGLAEPGWGTFQRRERLDLLAGAMTLRGVALLVPFAVVVPLYHWLLSSGRIPAGRLPDGTALAVWLQAAGFAAVLLLFDRPRVLGPRVWDVSTSAGSMRALAAQTFPLGAVALMVNLCDTVPRLVIEGQPGGRAALGYFGALAYITLAGNLVVIQAATAAANRLSAYYQTNLRAFLRLGLLLVGGAAGVGAVVLLIAWLFGRWILTVLYTPEYGRFETEFLLIVGANAVALLTNVLGAATTQMRLFWVQVPVQVITLASTIAAALLLIPGDNPVRGAAYTALVRAGVQFVLYAGCVGLGLAQRERVIERATSASR